MDLNIGPERPLPAITPAATPPKSEPSGQSGRKMKSLF